MHASCSSRSLVGACCSSIRLHLYTKTQIVNSSSVRKAQPSCDVVQPWELSSAGLATPLGVGAGHFAAAARTGRHPAREKRRSSEVLGGPRRGVGGRGSWAGSRLVCRRVGGDIGRPQQAAQAGCTDCRGIRGVGHEGRAGAVAAPPVAAPQTAAQAQQRACCGAGAASEADCENPKLC